MGKPLVSILISVYNAGEYLRPSVQSILSQTYSNLELLIIDDGSTDCCMDSIVDLRDPRIRVIRQENAGKAVALNRAMDELQGEFYAIHDADDISYPQRIEHQVDYISEHPELAAVFTGHDIILSGRRFAPCFRYKSIRQCREDIEQMHMPAHDPTVIFRVSMVKSIRYDPTLRVGQGWDYILRVGEQYPMVVLNKCLYSYHYHKDSNTRQSHLRLEDTIRNVVSKACQRRGIDISKVLPPKEDPHLKVCYKDKEHGIVPHFMKSVLDLRHAGQNWQAIRTALVSLSLHPLDLDYYKPLLYFFAPMKLINYYRKIKVDIYD
jgi:glycosyltransferase involved in cell wall biosynthesis